MYSQKAKRNVRDMIAATDVSIESGVSIGHHSSIRAERVVLGRGVKIGKHVHITCDTLELGEGSVVGDQTEIVCPQISLLEECFIGNSSRIELNEKFIMGKQSRIGRRFMAAGQGFECGEFLWLKDDVIVGGGGCHGPHAYLSIGDGTTVIDKCFINISEEVSIGNNTALSYNVTILTHGAWQPVLMGYPARFAPVRIGSHVVAYVNCVILPGVTINDYSALGANAVVNKDVPGHCLMVGNPAKIVKGPEGFPRPLEREEIDHIISSMLLDYLSTLHQKNVRVVEDMMSQTGYAVIDYLGKMLKIQYFSSQRSSSHIMRPDITLSYGPIPDNVAGMCHFDLLAGKITGALNPVGEDLRDYLRRRGIRIMTGSPFKSLPLANLQRLNAMKSK